MYPQAEKTDPIHKLVFELSKLPGIGNKTATRLAYFIIRQESSYSEALASALLRAKQKIGLCQECFTFTDATICAICEDTDRDVSALCVVESPSDVTSIEKTAAHRGGYHVLHGILSPLDGIGPENLKIRELLARLEKKNETREIILALNPSVEGDATSLYLSRLLSPLGIKTSKLAHGLPAGGQLEYSDQQTIQRAIENRVEMTE